jgi:hypothetical protein
VKNIVNVQLSFSAAPSAQHLKEKPARSAAIDDKRQLNIEH